MEIEENVTKNEALRIALRMAKSEKKSVGEMRGMAIADNAR